ncbi:sugar ABC transporter ATP-binding protein [Mesorhizobium sp. BR1-1-16]|uniref:sugar ABC transporter ATP-binding protein n=1 Tax=Mesorhizobium sp. BR1-1-16 TaxID=2876653 RepID=UPI001CC9597C|nr:sugar ABC transporter ATP-binding protein [Mesorhizobium sp. BR1-1-16]MBZ9938424.1 sugar ABC transporter ATP-binding protein [Mesorhizobium sp. BR1-1-16]
MSDETAIRTIGIAKSFAGVPALRGVDFSVRRGEIHALLGQNGAGKSTLVKILNGVHRAGSYKGSILLGDKDVSFRSPLAARAEGVGYVPQEIEVLEQLSVAENVFAGHTGLGRGVLLNRRLLNKRTEALFAELGLAINPRSLVAMLTAAQRHLVMIARALSMRPKVLMLDEPTASLSGAEVDQLFAVLRRLKAQGTTMIYITHRLPEVMAICDRATILRDGRVVAEIDRADFNEERIIYAMSGQKLQRLYPHHAAPTQSEVLLSVRDLSVEGRIGVHRRISGINFEVRAGEILGLVGLLGSGRTEILHAIYGRIPCSGNVKVANHDGPIRSISDARRAGIALLTEDRKRDGLLFNLPVGGNITIGNLEKFAHHQLVSRTNESKAVVQAMRALNVKARSPQASVAHLSGGNQQKLLFARVLMNGPRVLLLDEPTKGVDAATRHEIYRLITELADKGVALVIVASELEEVIGLSDRCVVVADGRQVDEFQRGERDEEQVLRIIAAAQAELTGQTALRTGVAT